MGLNSRQIHTLRSVSRSAEGVPLEELATAEGISERTVYYDISAVNDFLAEAGLGRVSVHLGYVCGDNVDWMQVGRLLASSGHGRLTGDERRLMLLLMAALSRTRVTIGGLMDSFEVSRNTVIADVREVKQSLLRFEVTLTSSAGDGYRLAGDESSIRRVLWESLQAIGGTEALSAVRTFLQSELVARTNEDIDFFELCRCLIKQYESDCETRCFLAGNGIESTMLQVSWIRSLDGHWIDMGPDEQSTLMGTLSYRSVQRSAAKLKASGIVLPEEELLYITSLLLGIKTAHAVGQREEEKYVVDLAERLASNFERVCCLNYVDKELVVKQMSHHIRPMYYRIKYGLQASNPLAADIKKMYPMTYEFARRATLCTGLDALSENEIAYLTIYLTAGLDRTMLEDGDTSSTKILVVGAENMSTITLLRQQVVDACGMSFDYAYASLDEVRRWEFGRYALVISLVPVPPQMMCDNMVQVSPFLTEDNLKQIFDVLRHNRIISRYGSMIDGIIDIVKRNLPDGGESLSADKLYFELFRHFNERDYAIGDEAGVQIDTPRLEETAVSAGPGMDWRDVVMEGCRAICETTGSRTLPGRMVNLLKSVRLQWYRMADDAVVVHCPMQGDECGRVLAQAVVGGGSIPG